MAIKTLIAATTSAVLSNATNKISLESGQRALIVDNGLAGAETCTINMILADGTSLAALDTDASTLLLTATDYQKGVVGPVNIQVGKDATVGATSVTVYY